MAKIEFSPELLLHIKAIYGDANLDGRALKLIHNTWQTNPELIRNTARQKILQVPIQSDPIKPELNTSPSNIPTLIKLLAREIANDDLTGVLSFGEAFKEARNRGLKLFRWRRGVYGTKLASPTRGKVEVGTPTVMNPTVTYNGNRATTNLNTIDDLGNIISKSENWIKPPSTNMFGLALTDKQLKNARSWERIPKMLVRYLQGGTMNNQEELQKAFLAYLIQDAAQLGIQLLSEQDLQAYAQQLGEDGIKAKYQEFMLKMQGGVMAKLGAKLEYYKKLKGICPEGYEMKYYKVGGRLCKSCLKKAEMKCGGKTKKAEDGKKLNAVEKFKAGRVKSDKCGSKMKK